ncbi:hypothetical protein ACIOC1_19190 [Streptomyces sp. NPDC088197]|uniref:hypothetical protein n=1 Tax=unclassified Streptomyces TaxID=2593676 RepID=UPI0033B486AD
MRQRIGLLAAAAVAILAPLGAATSASAAGEFHVSGVYYTQEQCQAAGAAGVALWGPNYFCSQANGFVYLYTH